MNVHVVRYHGSVAVILSKKSKDAMGVHLYDAGHVSSDFGKSCLCDQVIIAACKCCAGSVGYNVPFFTEQRIQRFMGFVRRIGGS